MDYHPVLLFEGRHRRRAEDGAAVRGRPEMRPCRLTGQDRGNPIMLMRRPRAGLVTQPPGGPGQPSAGITTGCLEWLHVTATTERWPPLPNEAPFEGGVCRCTEARLKGTQ